MLITLYTRALIKTTQGANDSTGASIKITEGAKSSVEPEYKLLRMLFNPL